MSFPERPNEAFYLLSLWRQNIQHPEGTSLTRLSFSFSKCRPSGSLYIHVHLRCSKYFSSHKKGTNVRRVFSVMVTQYFKSGPNNIQEATFVSRLQYSTFAQNWPMRHITTIWCSHRQTWVIWQFYMGFVINGAHNLLFKIALFKKKKSSTFTKPVLDCYDYGYIGLPLQIKLRF